MGTSNRNCSSTLSKVWALALLAGLLASTAAVARPVVFEEVAKLTSPNPSYQLLSDAVAIDGPDLLVLGFDTSTHSFVVGLFHFQRQSNGTWLSRGQLASGQWDDQERHFIEFEDGIAVFVVGRGFPQVLERTAGGWRTTRLEIGTVSDVAIYGGKLAIGSERDGNSVIHLVEKNAAGAWLTTETLLGAPGFSDNDFLGPDIEFARDELTAGNFFDNFEIFGETTYVFDRINGQWLRTGTLDGKFSSIVLDGDIALQMGAWTEPGDIATFYTRSPNRAWDVGHPLWSDEWFANKRPGHVVALGQAQHVLAFAAAPLDDGRGRDAGSITVLTREYPRLEHAATLMASDASAGGRLGLAMAASGRHVAAMGLLPPDTATGLRPAAAYVFELPDPLPAAVRVQDTFEDLNSAGWMPWGLTNWRVVASGGSQVFRQTNTQGDARAIFEGFEGTNQSIQADVKVNAFGIRGWAGLLVRYTDANNFYYLLNQGNTLQIRKIVNGVYGPIASTPFTLQVGRSYRFRLEAVGTRVRAYADDQLMLEVRDTAHSQGRTGLTMWKANTAYDNVIVTTGPYVTLHADSFSGSADEIASPPWLTSPANVWARATTSSDATVFRQSRAEGDARAVHGAPTEDQILTADIRPLAFYPSAGSDFVGLMARYIDHQNYYYVLLTKSGKVSLRRLTNGRITILDEAAFTVTPGTSYRVRFEAIGDALRLYVNGRLQAQAEDATFPQGRYGLVTYRTAAEFDNFNASRP